MRVNGREVEWRSIARAEVASWVEAQKSEGRLNLSIVPFMFLGGMRLATPPCDSGIACHVDGKVAAIATVAPDKENDLCEILGFYVEPEFRNQGLGSALFENVAHHILKARCFGRARICTWSHRVLNIIERYATKHPALHARIEVVDNTDAVDVDEWEDRRRENLAAATPEP